MMKTIYLQVPEHHKTLIISSNSINVSMRKTIHSFHSMELDLRLLRIRRSRELTAVPIEAFPKMLISSFANIEEFIC